jgi:hypothetical protein
MLLDPVEALEDIVDCSGLKLVVLKALFICLGGSLEAIALVFLMLEEVFVAFLAAKKDFVFALAMSSRTWRSALVA